MHLLPTCLLLCGCRGMYHAEHRTLRSNFPQQYKARAHAELSSSGLAAFDKFFG